MRAHSLRIELSEVFPKEAGGSEQNDFHGGILAHRAVVHTVYMPENTPSFVRESTNHEFLERYIQEFAQLAHAWSHCKKIHIPWWINQPEEDFNYYEPAELPSTQKVELLRADVADLIRIFLSLEEMRDAKELLMTKRRIQECCLRLKRNIREACESNEWIKKDKPPSSDVPQDEFAIAQRITGTQEMIRILNKIVAEADAVNPARNIGGSDGLESAVNIVREHTHINWYSDDSSYDIEFYQHVITGDDIDRIVDALLRQWDELPLEEIGENTRLECVRLDEEIEECGGTRAKRERLICLMELQKMIRIAQALRRIRHPESVETDH
jgi:hypothetical protein